jgi:hypothetical protein
MGSSYKVIISYDRWVDLQNIGVLRVVIGFECTSTTIYML